VIATGGGAEKKWAVDGAQHDRRPTFASVVVVGFQVARGRSADPGFVEAAFGVLLGEGQRGLPTDVTNAKMALRLGIRFTRPWRNGERKSGTLRRRGTRMFSADLAGPPAGRRALELFGFRPRDRGEGRSRTPG